MVAAIAAWRTMTGIRRTSASDTLEVIVEAYTDLNPSGENGVKRVDFSVVVNGGAPTVTSVLAPDLHFPNYSAAQSPVSGSRGGLMAPVYGYGITLDCNVLAQGTIVVTANVVSNAGTVTAVTLPTSSITLYNDKGGADSRPNTNVVYWSWQTGSDANTGLLLAAPKKNLRNILETYGPECGGLQIIALPGLNYVGGDTSLGVSIKTSGHWWVDVICVPGSQFTRYNPYPNFILAPCTSDPPGTEFRLRFIGDGQQWFEDGFSFQVNTGRPCHGWIDGGFSGPTTYDPGKPWTVLYANTGASVGPIGQDGDVSKCFKYMTSHTRLGLAVGYIGYRYVHDGLMKDFTGISISPVNAIAQDTVCNVDVRRHRYAEAAVLGFLDLAPSATCQLSVPSANQLRVTAIAATTLFNTGQSIDLATQCNELVGLTNWGLRFEGFGFPTTDCLVLDAGHDGLGRAYFTVSLAGAVGGAIPGGARIRTAVPSGNLYTTVIHPDLFQTQSGITGSLWSGIRCEDVIGMRGIVDQGGTMTRCAVVNCTSASLKNNDDLGASWVDCLFFHNNFHHWNLGSFNAGCNLVDNVCDHATNFPVTGFLRNNHFIAGSTGGVSPTSGAFYAQADISQSPWSLQPTPGNIGTSSGLIPGPVEWRWSSGADDSRGIWNMTGVTGGSSDVSVTGQPFEFAMTFVAPEGSINGGVTIVPALWGDPMTFVPPEASVTALGVSVPATTLPPSGGGTRMKRSGRFDIAAWTREQQQREEHERRMRESVRQIERKKL